MADLVGTWLSVFTYQKEVAQNDCSEHIHVCLVYKKANQLIIESTPGSASYLVIRLSLDGRIATGSWEQQRAETSSSSSIVIWGAVQLIVNEAGNALEGMWVGFGSAAEVVSGSWKFTCIQGDLSDPHTVHLNEVSKSFTPERSLQASNL